MTALDPHYTDRGVTLYHGDCLDVLRTLPDASVDAVVTDPPYGLGNTTPQQVQDAIARWIAGDRDYLPRGPGGFMGAAWDAFVPPVAVWDECLRVLKPGGHLLAFAGARTQDIMGLAIRLAGFEIRDLLAWIYGQGFPKSLDVSLALDQRAGAVREDRGEHRIGSNTVLNPTYHTAVKGSPVTPEAKQWAGWQTALKPAIEPITLARKPLVGTVAENVLTHGTGALNVDATRVGDTGGTQGLPTGQRKGGARSTDILAGDTETVPLDKGRWPTNVLVDELVDPEVSRQAGTDEIFPVFRYAPKASTGERPRDGEVLHPTVKPLDLMRWLVRLVTPPGGTVLEPFAGSGTTAEACVIEGFGCIAIEREADYLPLITNRLNRRTAPVEFLRATGADMGLFEELEGGAL